MITDRKAWAQRLMTDDAELADFLKSMRSEFQATVMKLEHSEPDLCWNLPEPWAADEGVSPCPLPILSKKK